MIRWFAAFAWIAAAFHTHAAGAHELRPAYLDIRETAPDLFAVVWKVPALGDMRLGLYVRLPQNCKPSDEPIGSMTGGAFFERQKVSCVGGLKDRQIVIDGLRSTLTDVLVRIEYLGGSTEVARMTPATPSFVASGAQGSLDVARTYFVLGIDHILTGLDHLLFVLVLILLIRDPWMLAKTITAFTVAHSLTLAAAVLGYVSLPQKPVEATVALSIAFVASELAKLQSGERSSSEAYPWIVAFAFGLLHGLGFAGALKEIGLPQTDVPLALLMFNLGVEAGQLMFIAFVLVGLKACKALFEFRSGEVRTASAYAIGSLAMVWLISRVSGF